MIVAWLSSLLPDQSADHQIDHNYIHDFAEPQIKDNGYATLRIGTSKYSHVNARVTVEYNCFYRCNVEVECISNKSSENTCRHNTSIECQGKLTLHHGDRNLVEANFFIGSNVSRTGVFREPVVCV